MRHDGDPGLEAGQAQRQLREHDQGNSDHDERIAMLRGERCPPVRDQGSVPGNVSDGDQDHYEIEEQVDRHEHDGDADGFLETTEEYEAEQRDQEQGDQHLLTVHPGGSERVLDRVGRGVCRRQGDGDHEVRGGEPEQDEHEELPGPPRQQAFQHLDRTRPVEALLCNPSIHRQGTQKSQGDQHDGRDRRQQTGREGRDGRLVPEGGEIVNPGQAHHPPPGMRLLDRGGVGTHVIGALVDEALEHPGADAVGDSARVDHPQTLLRGDTNNFL